MCTVVFCVPDILCIWEFANLFICAYVAPKRGLYIAFANFNVGFGCGKWVDFLIIFLNYFSIFFS